MLLAADVGNSAVKFALFEGSRCVATARVASADLAGSAALPDLGAPWDEAVAVSVSAPGLAALERAAGRRVLVLGRDLPLLVANRYRRPEEAGHDRLVNAAAAHAEAGGAAVAVDAGSAVTVDAVGRDGAFLGGAIAPGLGAHARGLAGAAPALPTWDGRSPAGGVPATTAEAIRAGVVTGFVGAVERLVREVSAALIAAESLSAPPAVLVTGGDGPLLCATTVLPVRGVPDLTLVGVRILYERGKGRTTCT